MIIIETYKLKNIKEISIILKGSEDPNELAEIIGVRMGNLTIGCEENLMEGEKIITESFEIETPNK